MPPKRDPEVATRDRNPAEVALARFLDGDLFKEHVLSRLNHTDISCLCNVNSGLRIYIKAARPHIGPFMYVSRFVRSLESFEWALANGLTFQGRQTRQGHRTLAHAVKAGNLDVIKRVMAALREADPYFRLPNKEWSTFRQRAWLNNKVEVMEWVVTNGTFDKDSAHFLSQDNMLRCLVDGGQLPMLKWWFEKYGASDIILSKRQFTKAAASRGGLEVLKWLVENGFKFSADCLAAAARYGELECIEYLREIGCPWSNAVFERLVARFRSGFAMVEKCVPILRYLMETGCPYDALSVLKQLDDMFDSNTHTGCRHAANAANGEYPENFGPNLEWIRQRAQQQIADDKLAAEEKERRAAKRSRRAE
tara:strand:+ start:224 stop:1318 length:1095 start_codon:yes stop_codon:yes gene_type:complete